MNNSAYDDGLFKNNLPYVIIFNIDKALGGQLGTAIHQKMIRKVFIKMMNERPLICFLTPATLSAVCC
ncbi:hypothetical protein CFSAN002369_13325 [Clostridium botulinum CFSAN002369]|nr:hypothetical protein CFSAN002369_13325 [Clostridium botulinum CFSAN002369]